MREERRLAVSTYVAAVGDNCPVERVVRNGGKGVVARSGELVFVVVSSELKRDNCSTVGAHRERARVPEGSVSNEYH